MYPIHLKFAVYGSSGSGKSELLKILSGLEQNITIHRRDTTRKPRETENPEKTLDLRFLNLEDFEKRRTNGEYDVTYRMYDNWYGVRRDQLVQAFERKETHFTIIRDISALQQFKYMYPDVKAMYIHTDPEDIPEHLQKREGVTFNERLRRIQIEYKEFIENNTLFDHIILNFWDEDNAIRQIRNVLHHYARKAASNL